MTLPESPQEPKIFQLLQWILNPTGYMERLASQYGDIFRMPALTSNPRKPVIFVSNPEGLQHLLSRDRGQDFCAPEDMNEILRPIVGSQSLLLQSGATHQRQRKLLMPPFHGDRLKVYGEKICEISDRVFAALPLNQMFPMRQAMQDVTLQVMMEVVFGLSKGERYDVLKPLLAQFTDFLGSPWRASLLFFGFLQQDWGPWSPWGRMVSTRQQIDELLYAEIRERRQQDCRDREDILSLMMTARDENGELLSETEVRDELLTLLLAGHETTASALAWAFYWIHQNPRIYEKVMAELNELGPNPDPMSIYKLPYLTAVCNETLRIAPAAMLTFFRHTTRPLEFMGYQLDTDTPVVGSIYLVHRRPDIYPNPEQFRPERFLERDFSPYEFVPFGAGMRRCIGAVLAQYEMKLTLATVLSRYSLQLCENRPVKPQRRGITLAPGTGVRMKITEVTAETGDRATVAV
ncbi:MAG: cytochrome P450 [Spirulinaceae cyanobacterium]